MIQKFKGPRLSRLIEAYVGNFHVSRILEISKCHEDGKMLDALSPFVKDGI